MDQQKIQWNDIDSAPMDGTVILTDEGTAKYADHWGIDKGWYLCTTHGDIAHCADDGYIVSSVSPKRWTYIPLDEGTK